MAMLRRRRNRVSIALVLLLLSRNSDTNAFDSSIWIASGNRVGLIGSGQQRRKRPAISKPTATLTTTRVVELMLLPHSSLCPRHHQHDGFFSRDPSCHYHQSKQEDFDALKVTSSIYDSSSSSSTENVRLASAAAARTEESTTALDASSHLTVVQSKPTTTTKRKRRSSSSSRLKWDNMIVKLEQFRQTHGHSLITSDYCDDDDLYRWAVTIRRNYRHQVLATKRIIHQSSCQSRRHRQIMQQPTPSDTTTTTTSSSQNVQYSSSLEKKSKIITTTITTSRRQNQRGQEQEQQPQRRRPRLSTEKLLQLSALDFCWDVQAAVWDRHYDELRVFYKQHGHVNIPPNSHPGLALWAQNQRREYRRLLKHGPESSTLTLDNRLERLESISFGWCQSHEDAWLFQYEELKKFHAQYGHSNVPEDYPNNFALGQWCMNQRTAYKRYIMAAGGGGHNNNATTSTTTTAMSRDRIQKLEQLDFCWAYREQKWNDMKQRLVDYYSQHGNNNIQIPTNDVDNQDLRMWLIMQRYYYNRRRGGQRHYRASVKRDAMNDKGDGNNDDDINKTSSTGSSSIDEGLLSPLTESRIAELEKSIPGFRWTAYETGPSRKDWAKLFNAMREKGIQPGMRPKQHWFEGTNPFSVTVKDRWTEEDLLELWNQDGNDDDDDDESWRAL